MTDTPMPERIARLDRDSRGYPIPWNVLRNEEGFPFFTINDDRRTFQAIRESRCPICGERLGRWLHFIGGPRSAFDPHGVYFDLPVHHDCGNYALATCPYLAMPKYLGRIDVVHPEKLPPEAGPIMADFTQNPGRPEIFVVVAATRIIVLPHPLGATAYVKPAAVAGYEFWRHGKQITQAEAMPFLRTVFGEEWRVPAAPCE